MDDLESLITIFINILPIVKRTKILLSRSTRHYNLYYNLWNSIYKKQYYFIKI